MGVGLIVDAEVMRGQLGHRVRHEDSESKLIREGESAWPCETPT